MSPMFRQCQAQGGVCLILKLSGILPPAQRGAECVALHTVLAEFLASKTAGNRRAVYVSSLKYYVTRFVNSIDPGLDVARVSPSQVEHFINQFKGYARQTWLNRISSFFSFAVRRDYIERNPCKQLDRVKIDRKPPVVLTVEQARGLLASCPNVCKPYLILGMFAGIRPDEIHRMTWADVNLETGTARVQGKTGQRRIVYLEPVAIRHLERHPLRTGPVCPSKETVRRWKRKARAQLGGKWTADVLRHTAASYLVALWQDVAKVALSLGNSPQVLLRHYHDPVTQDACKKFWAGCLPMSADVRLAATGDPVDAQFDGKTNGKGHDTLNSRAQGKNGSQGEGRTAELKLDGLQSVQNAA